MNQVKLVIDGEGWSSMGSHIEVSFLMPRMTSCANPTVKFGIILTLTASVIIVVGSISRVSIVTAMCSRFLSLPFGVFIASNGFIQPREE